MLIKPTLRIVGTETEYGISVEGSLPNISDHDLNAVSERVIRNVPHFPPSGRRRRRRRRPTESAFDYPYWLTTRNGGRAYVDHMHPEKNTPEVTNPRDAVCYDVAGDRIMAAAAAQTSLDLRRLISLFKDNTDRKYPGQSYAGHVNISYDASTYWGWFRAALLPFLCALPVLCGAGAMCGSKFWVSQRARFFEIEVGSQTIVNRPIINTRDESLDYDPSRGRMHIIACDVNRNEVANYLKLGLLMIVMELAEAHAWPWKLQLLDPVAAFWAFGSDPELTATARLLDPDKGSITAIEILRAYVEAARLYFDSHPALDWQNDVLDRAERQLGLLERRELAEAARASDWLTKWRLLQATRERDGLAWGNPKLAQLDIGYGSLRDPSPFSVLTSRGKVDRILGDAEIEAARVQAPPDTRAATRALLLDRYPGNGHWQRVDLGEPHEDNVRVRFFKADAPTPVWLKYLVAGCPTVVDLARQVRAAPSHCLADEAVELSVF